VRERKNREEGKVGEEEGKEGEGKGGVLE